MLFVVCSISALQMKAELLRSALIALTAVIELIFLIRLGRLIITLNRLEKFDRYRAELLKRWPDLVLPE
jgi:hypothetical protein